MYERKRRWRGHKPCVRVKTWKRILIQEQSESQRVCESEERLKIKYLNECALSHPQTHQQPLGNKNVQSVIVNYKYWSLPYCSLLIMPNGLPLTITKPLTQCASVFMPMCERGKPAYLKKYAIISLFFMVLKAPVPRIFPCLPSVCSYVFDVSDQNEKIKEKKKGRNGKLKTSCVKD